MPNSHAIHTHYKLDLTSVRPVHRQLYRDCYDIAANLRKTTDN